MLMEHMKELWIKLSDHKELIEKFKNAEDDKDYDLILREAGCSFNVEQVKKNIRTVKKPKDKISAALDLLNDYDLEFISGGTGHQNPWQPDSRIPDTISDFFQKLVEQSSRPGF